jgi:colanic acid biosynthesis glycosyl transferase WcaI
MIVTRSGAALKLKTRNDIVFCFVGGGSEQTKVSDFALRHELRNVKCLPYQPLRDLSSSLSAADLHVVVMGDAFVGIVHPCKIYNIMSIGAPVLYIGPQPSHVTDIASEDRSEQFSLTQHGDVEQVVAGILKASEGSMKLGTLPTTVFSKQMLLPQLVNAIGGNSFENLFRPLPDSDNRLADYHAGN